MKTVFDREPAGNVGTPKYYQIKRYICDKIKSGKFARHTCIPSENELSKSFSVNKNTVVRALRELTQEGLLFRVQGKGTFVAEKEMTNVIGIMGMIKEKTFFSDTFYLGMMKGIDIVLHEREKSFHFKKMASKLSSTFAENSVDGIIVRAPLLCFEDELIKLAQKIPSIVIGSAFSAEAINYVASDNIGDSFSAVEQLIKSGHRKIAFITSGEASMVYQDRLKGYKKALEKYQIGFDENLVLAAGDNFNKIEKIMTALVELKPTAIFGVKTVVTQRIVEMIQRNGLRIPQDVEILTYDYTEGALSEFNIPYLAIEQPLQDMGRKTAESLLDIIDGKVQEPVKINLKSKIIAR